VKCYVQEFAANAKLLGRRHGKSGIFKDVRDAWSRRGVPLLTWRLTYQLERLILMEHIALLHICRFSAMCLSRRDESRPPESFRIHEGGHCFRPLLMLRGSFSLRLRFTAIQAGSKEVFFGSERMVGSNRSVQFTIEVGRTSNCAN
jgi:hypothetical protein